MIIVRFLVTPYIVTLNLTTTLPQKRANVYTLLGLMRCLTSIIFMPRLGRVGEILDDVGKNVTADRHTDTGGW